jgi:hypothetical protein
MGLLAGDALPEMGVFVEQGQFEPIDRASPDPGTNLVASQVPVIFSDFLAADGPRAGPPVERVRRAVIYVSRNGLASQDEMDVVNFFAARGEARQGVSSWDQYPSFFEATGGRAVMSTEITALSDLLADEELEPSLPAEDVAVEDLDVAVDALAGVLLDEPIPGRVAHGESVRLSGIVTAKDRDDFSIVCFRFIRYGTADLNDQFICSTLVGNRFALDVTFSSGQVGSYTVEPFLFWPGAERQFARSRYGVIVVH